jgi:hypothetical protein
MRPSCMRNAICWAFLLVGIGVFLPLNRALADGIPVADRLVISANARTPSEFPTTFNPLDMSFPESTETTTPFTWFIGFRPSTPTNPHGSTFDASVVFLDPGSTAISDIVTLHVVATFDATGAPLGQNWTVIGTSDTNAGPPLDFPSGFYTTTTETGDLQDISGLFVNSRDQTRITPLFNVFGQSDTEVPEPSSLFLLGTASAMLVCWHRRAARRT